MWWIQHFRLWNGVYVFMQLEQLQMSLTADRESLRNAETLSTDLLKEKAQLEKTLETLQENSERQVIFSYCDCNEYDILSHL